MPNEQDEFLSFANGEEKKDESFKKDENDFFIQEKNPEPEKEESKEIIEEIDENVPFNKNPKIQKYIDKEISKRIGEIKPEKTTVETFVKETVPEKDEANEILTRIIGNDTPEKQAAIKDFKNYLNSLEEKGARKALERLEEQAQQEQVAEMEVENELVDGFETIEEVYGVDITSGSPQARKTRSDFVDFIRRVAPKNENGEVTDFPDFTETFKLFQDISKKSQSSNSRAKELASRSSIRSSDATVIPENTDKSWKAVDKLFEKLSD